MSSRGKKKNVKGEWGREGRKKKGLSSAPAPRPFWPRSSSDSSSTLSENKEEKKGEGGEGRGEGLGITAAGPYSPHLSQKEKLKGKGKKEKDVKSIATRTILLNRLLSLSSHFGKKREKKGKGKGEEKKGGRSSWPCPLLPRTLFEEGTEWREDTAAGPRPCAADLLLSLIRER